MTLSDRDRRAVTLLVPTLLLSAGYWWMTRDTTPAVVGASGVNSIPLAEKRLQRLRQVAATVLGKEQTLQQVTTELASREKNLIQAETAAQAEAHLLQIIRKVAKTPDINIDLRNTELGKVQPYGDSYGEVNIAVNFEARIEQLVNFLSELTAQKELIGTTDIHIGTANPKQKTMPVRITISALVPRELLPDKKGPGL